MLFLLPKIIAYVCVHVKSLQSCPNLCNPTDYSPPASSVQGILQARIAEWAVITSSEGSSQLRDQTRISLCLLHWQVHSLPLLPPENPITAYTVCYKMQVISFLDEPWKVSRDSLTVQLIQKDAEDVLDPVRKIIQERHSYPKKL